MDSILTSVASRTTALPPSLLLDSRRISAFQVARKCRANNGASSTVRGVQARKFQGHGVAVTAEGQSPWMSENEKRNVSRSSGGKARRLEYDVVIVGAGIIGISIAHHILLNTTLSVALIDAVKPCAGATGAGQGYIWMSHRMPGSPGWALASRSKLLWEELAMELQTANVDPVKAMGWRNTGSLLVASTNDEAEALQKWVAAMSETGVPAEYLTAMEAIKAEPALSPDHLAAAAFFPEDSQIDAKLTVTLLQQNVRRKDQ